MSIVFELYVPISGSAIVAVYAAVFHLSILCFGATVPASNPLWILCLYTMNNVMRK